MRGVVSILLLVLVLPAASSGYTNDYSILQPRLSAVFPSPSFIPPSLPAEGVAPPYAFDGAYANYTLTYYTAVGPYVYRSNFTISEVNVKGQTFSVRSIYNSYMAPYGSVDNATFVDPIPFPAASPSQLQLFKEDKAPVGYYNDNFTSNVLVTVPAGTYVTYEVQAPVSTVWFDSVTGIIVKENGLMLGAGPAGYVALTLSSTNVKANAHLPGEPFIFQLILSVVVATVLVFFAIRLAIALGRNRRNRRVKSTILERFLRGPCLEKHASAAISYSTSFDSLASRVLAS